MGTIATIELANQVGAGTMTLDAAVLQHLSGNFFNPVREGWIPVCVDIIKRCKAGDDDLSYKIHAPDKPYVFLTAESIVEDLHLEPFIGIE